MVRHACQLGMVIVDLAEYAGRQESERRYLLQPESATARQDNSILKVNPPAWAWGLLGYRGQSRGRKWCARGARRSNVSHGGHLFPSPRPCGGPGGLAGGGVPPAAGRSAGV
jgi:hypothetical protein